MSKARELANLGNAYSDGALSNRNLLINSAMQVAQRGTSFTTGSSDMYTLDRWKSQGTYDTESLTIEQSTDAPDGFGKSLKVTVSTAEGTVDTDDYNIITQKLEGQNLTQLAYGSSAANQITLSFWVKASIAQTYCVSLYQTNGNKHYSATYAVNTPNTWEYKVVNILGNTATAIAYDNSQELEVGFMLGAGATYSGGSNNVWGGVSNFAAGASHTFITTAGATFYITGVQLELGDTATPFEHRSYGDELARCHRYYYQDDTGAHFLRSFYAPATGDWYEDYPLPVVMRATPTWTSQLGGDVSNVNAVSISGRTAKSGYVRFTVSSTGQGYCSLNTVTADAEL
jgi:hypothetical protein